MGKAIRARFASVGVAAALFLLTWAANAGAQAMWSPSELVFDGPGIPLTILTAADAAGNVTAVWWQWRGEGQSEGTDFWTSQYTSSAGWNSATKLLPDPSGGLDLSFSMNGAGEAALFWSDGIRIFAIQHSREGGWGDVLTIHSTPFQLFLAGSGMDDAGNAIVVWSELNSTVWGIWANRYDAGSGWGTPTQVSVGGDTVGLASLAMNATGTGLAVWSQRDVGYPKISTSFYRVGSGWSPQEPLEMASDQAGLNPRAALNSFGQAVVVWNGGSNFNDDVWADRYSSGAGWEPPVHIENLEGREGVPLIVLDEAGNAIAAWSHSDANDIYNELWSSRYTANRGWDAPTALQVAGSGSLRPSLALDRKGDALLVWVESDLVARWYVSGKGWTLPVSLGVGNEPPRFGPVTTIDDHGQAVVIWSAGQLHPPVMKLWARHSTAPSNEDSVLAAILWPWGISAILATSLATAVAAIVVRRRSKRSSETGPKSRRPKSLE